MVSSTAPGVDWWPVVNALMHVIVEVVLDRSGFLTPQGVPCVIPLL